MDNIDIVMAGHLCLDLLPDLTYISAKALTEPGRLYQTGAIAVSTGGAVSNTGLALHRLGARVRLMSLVGDDLIGQLTLNYLKARDPHLADGIKIKVGQPASNTIVLSPAGADRTFLHCPGTNDSFTTADIDFEAVAQAKMFHLGYPPLLPRLTEKNGLELSTIFRRAKQAGAVTSLDMVLPDPNSPSGKLDWRAILAASLPNVDIFIPSIEETLFMLRRADYDAWLPDVLSHLTRDYLFELAGELLAMGSAIAGFKLGEMGLYLRTAGSDSFQRLSRLERDWSGWADQEQWHPAFQVEVAGTTGAGDAAYAGFLVALTRGATPYEALRWACAVGACDVEAVDATSGVRTWEETGKRLAAGWSPRLERLTGYTNEAH